MWPETFDDIEPLFKQIERGHDTGESILSYTVGALLNTSQNVRIGARADAWTQLLDNLAQVALTNRIAAEMCRLTSALLDQKSTDPQIAALGRVSRALFDFAWKASPYQQWLILQSLRSVGRTYSTDPAASAETTPPHSDTRAAQGIRINRDASLGARGSSHPGV